MSFNKRIVPALDRLVEMREKINDDEAFLKMVFGKGDCFMGPAESFDYLNEIRNKLNK
jgi:hypothetical protein